MVEAHIVRDFSIGSTRIKIADNYCSRNAEEVKRILNRIAEHARRHIIAAASTGNYETQTTTES